ncbi:hypothetical protein COMA1_40339 [Candidatus Nitrospira nitrosa]|uniref:Uncharacterized protein n=1 Tax=Candidatus Nitrospira nitrosa TaxID=1742972 RepID=A0A0S4LK35_9BACT|nr:hypothetical protein COMA1_40339 [Candidatus Nitrospira nitrosa]
MTYSQRMVQWLLPASLRISSPGNPGDSASWKCRPMPKLKLPSRHSTGLKWVAELLQSMKHVPRSHGQVVVVVVAGVVDSVEAVVAVEAVESAIAGK